MPWINLMGDVGDRVGNGGVVVATTSSSVAVTLVVLRAVKSPL